MEALEPFAVYWAGRSPTPKVPDAWTRVVVAHEKLRAATQGTAHSPAGEGARDTAIDMIRELRKSLESRKKE
jgi:hypothetical protein